MPKTDPGPVTWRLNTRIQHGENRGVIRYVGTLPNRGSETWIGIEWDDIKRGKHSGTIDGICYFKTAQPGAGSFLKARKLGFGGRTHLMQAVTKRYIADASDATFRNAHHVVGGADVTILAKEFERVLGALSVVDISGLGVALLQDDNQESERSQSRPRYVLSCMSHLRLARSLFDSIHFVFQILTEFPQLEVLDISRNVLRDDTAVDDSTGRFHLKMRELIVNHTLTTWSAITKICNWTSALREIRLRNCPLGSSHSECASWADACPQARLVDLGATGVSWQAVLAGPAKLLELEELYLDDNQLCDTDEFQMAFDLARTNSKCIFPRLRSLGLSGNALEGWCIITILHGLERLSRLRIDSNPICADETDEMTGRMQAIARIAGLKVLDGSSVGKDERIYAERRYIFMVCAKAVKEVGMKEAKQMHLRMEELCEKHGIDIERWYERGRSGMWNGMISVCMRVDGRVQAKRTQVVRMMPRGVPLEKVRRVAVRLLEVDNADRIALGIEADKRVERDVDESREIDFWAREGRNGSQRAITVVLG